MLHLASKYCRLDLISQLRLCTYSCHSFAAYYVKQIAQAISTLFYHITKRVQHDSTIFWQVWKHLPHCKIIIFLWNTVQSKLLNLWKF